MNIGDVVVVINGAVYSGFEGMVVGMENDGAAIVNLFYDECGDATYIKCAYDKNDLRVVAACPAATIKEAKQRCFDYIKYNIEDMQNAMLNDVDGLFNRLAEKLKGHNKND